jgi:hypothetical protein
MDGCFLFPTPPFSQYKPEMGRRMAKDMVFDL